MKSRALFGLLLLALPVQASAQTPEPIVLASTTSLDNSGLLARILPVFTAQTGIVVRVVAQGTGQALATAAKGDADLVLVHDPEAEATFMAAGHGVSQVRIAWNDFIVIGPTADPAHIAGSSDAVAAFRQIAATASPFVSRGDSSGTDALDKRLWKSVGLDPAAASQGAGAGQGWYRDIGGGMGAALNAAAAMQAYTLSDRGTWLSFGRKAGLTIVVQGGSRLLNRYDVIELSPNEHVATRQPSAHRLAEWLASPAGQTAIGSYAVGGERLFHPVADPEP